MQSPYTGGFEGLGDQLKITARVVYTGKTTITVQCDIRRFGRSIGDKALSNSCLSSCCILSSDFRNLQPHRRGILAIHRIDERVP